VRAGYDVLIGMGVITYFVPFLLMFAAALRLESGAGESLVPRALLKPAAVLGILTTAISVALAAFPPGEGHPWLAASKVIGGSAFLAGVGALLYARGRKSLDD
jgi:hypothetical protein